MAKRKSKGTRKSSRSNRASSKSAPRDIQAKPSTYRRQLFKSRLEARWAVFLDWNPLVDSWDYEPQSYRLADMGWTYLPDFLVKVGPFMFYLEIKPEIPGDDYLPILGEFARSLPYPLVLAQGSFFKGVPSTSNLTVIAKEEDLTVDNIKAVEERLGKSALFADCKDAIAKASRHRFDLRNSGREEAPPFRGGNPAETKEHINRWSLDQRKKAIAEREAKRAERKGGKGK